MNQIKAKMRMQRCKKDEKALLVSRARLRLLWAFSTSQFWRLFFQAAAASFSANFSFSSSFFFHHFQVLHTHICNVHFHCCYRGRQAGALSFAASDSLVSSSSSSRSKLLTSQFAFVLFHLTALSLLPRALQNSQEIILRGWGRKGGKKDSSFQFSELLFVCFHSILMRAVQCTAASFLVGKKGRKVCLSA